MHDKFRAKLNLDVGLLHARKDVYSLGISDKCGNLLQHCMGFIDATLMRCCRPIVFQEAVYNGHKRAHSLKLQSIVCPDGMVGHLFGPVEGRRHGTTVLEYTGLLRASCMQAVGLVRPPSFGVVFFSWFPSF